MNSDVWTRSVQADKFFSGSQHIFAECFSQMEMIFPLGKAVMIRRLKKWDLMSEISRCDEFSFGYYNTILFKKKTFLLISLRKFRLMKRWSARRVKIVYKTFDSSLWERERSPETPWQEAVLQWRNAKSVANVEKMQKIEKNQKKLLTFPQIYIILTYVIETRRGSVW